MKMFVTFGQNHRIRIDNNIFNKDCLAIVNGNEDKVKEVFGEFYSSCYSEADFNIDSIQFYPRRAIEVPEKIEIKMVMDPLRKFNKYKEDELYNLLGALPYWVINQEYMDKPLKEALDDQYGFGLFEATGQTIEKDGTYKYPGDPDLYPIIKIERKDEIFYQYLYAMVVIIQKDGNAFVTRMD